MSRDFGLGRGKVFPAKHASSLLNPLRRLIQPPKHTVARMNLKSTDNVLEIGCGPGYFSGAIARAVSGGSLVLFDLQDAMLDLARNRLREFPNVRFTQGDALSLPFSDASFDAILVVLMLGEVPDQNRCIAEVSRVLRPGGSVTFAESRRDSDFIPFAELRTCVERNNLELVEKRGPAWEYTARFRRN